MTTIDGDMPIINRATRRSLGKFGKKKPLLDASFDYFDVEIRVNPKMTNLAVMGFMNVASGIDTDDQMASMAAITDFLKSAVHPEDWDKFWAIALDERQSLEDFMALQWQLMEVVTEAESDRPFTPRSDSSDGLGITEARSKDDSFSRVMERMEGRPDLRSTLLTAKEYRERTATEAASIN